MQPAILRRDWFFKEMAFVIKVLPLEKKDKDYDLLNIERSALLKTQNLLGALFFF